MKSPQKGKGSYEQRIHKEQSHNYEYNYDAVKYIFFCLTLPKTVYSDKKQTGSEDIDNIATTAQRTDILSAVKMREAT